MLASSASARGTLLPCASASARGTLLPCASTSARGTLLPCASASARGTLLPCASTSARGTLLPRAAALIALLLAAAVLAVPASAQEQLQANRDNSVNGGKLHIEYANGAYLRVQCAQGAPLALDEALPAASVATRVSRATLHACAPPQAGYASALRSLRVQLAPNASLVLELPRAGEPLEARHLRSLALGSLALRARAGAASPPPRAGLLAGLALARLEVRGVALPPHALDAAPDELTALTLLPAGAGAVPAPLLARLSALVADARVTLEGAAPRLRTLSLTLARGEEPPAGARFPALRFASLTGWSAREPAPLTACATLESLTLTLPGFSSLPERWLAACSALEVLALQSAMRLRSLPAGLLEGECGAGRARGACVAPALTSLSIRYSALRSLPDTIFDPVPNLRSLDLKHNELLTLPGGIFTKLTHLTSLNLAENKFEDDSVYLVLGVLHELSELDLSGNKRLGDACSGGEYVASAESHLSTLKKLTTLQLSGTAVTRICRDWRIGMPHLRMLRLHRTNISHLTFEDLQHSRDNATLSPSVELLGSRVRRIEYSAEDETLALRAAPARVQIWLDSPLACDCSLFRAMRAMRTRPEHVDLRGSLRCEAPALPLATVPLDDMVCAAPSLCAALPPACACAVREQGAAGRERWHARVVCERAGLRAVPALKAPPHRELEWDLRLAGNNISELDELPPGLRSLDLRNNSIRGASTSAAAALGDARRVLLAGNPLSCQCGAAPFLRALGALRRRDPAALGTGARCQDGRALAEAAAAPLSCERASLGVPLLSALGATLGALALAALALGAQLARPERRARLKGVLQRWGWLPRAPEDADEARPYDAFVSYAHEDEAAARELCARLEAGPRALRLCLHSRDWAPGEYIDAQIAASVRCARRTVALVSRSWLASRWARAELREALAASAARPRLVLVLLAPARTLPPDRELHRCMRSCTYLERDHPQFWQRLRDALPEPRAPALPPEPAPCAAPAPTSPPCAAPAPTSPPCAAPAPTSPPCAAPAPTSPPLSVPTRAPAPSTAPAPSAPENYGSAPSVTPAPAPALCAADGPAPTPELAETLAPGPCAIPARPVAPGPAPCAATIPLGVRVGSPAAVV